MDLVYLFKVLWKNKLLLILTPLISLVIAYFLTENLPKEYISTAQLSTGFTDQSSLGYYAENYNIRESSIKFVNVIQTMNSPVVVNLLSYRLILHDLNTKEKPFRRFSDLVAKAESAGRPVTMFSQEELERLADQIVIKLENFELLNPYDETDKKIMSLLKLYQYDYASLTRNLNISRVGVSDFINIEYKSNDPFFSAYVVNAMSEQFIRYYSNLKTDESSTNLDFFVKIRDQKKSLLDQKTDEYNQIKNSKSIIDPGVDIESMSSLIKETEAKRNSYTEELNGLNLKINAIDDKFSSYGQDKAYSTNEKIIELNKKISELKQSIAISQPGKSRDDIEQLLSQLRSELHSEIRRSSQFDETGLLKERESLDLQRKIVRSNLASVDQNLIRLKSRVNNVVSRESLLATLQKEIDKLTEEYLQSVNDYNKENNKTLITESQIKVIVPGQPSETPLTSRRAIMIGLATVATLIFCIFGVILLEYIDVRLKTPLNFKRQTKLALFGTLNQTQTDNLNLNALFGQIKSKEQELFKHSLRKLRYELLKDKSSKVFMVTSTKKGEGKSFIILCLAYSLSMINKRVLIIDTNFKNSTLTKFLIKEDPVKDLKIIPKMLTDNISQGGYIEDDPERDRHHSIIARTTHHNIDIIGSKQVSDSPLEIFSERNFNEMIRKVSVDYDFVFMEGAPLNDFSDTKELAEYVDKIIPVFSAGSSVNQKDNESIEYLKSLNGKLAGSILNKVKAKDLEI